MIRELGFKPDFARTVERFEAWWAGEVVDHPPISCGVRVKADRGPAPPGPAAREYPDHRSRWFDLEARLDAAIAHMHGAVYPLDAIPVFYANLGPELTSTPLGCGLEFSQTTSWSTPIVESAEQWAEVAEKQPDFANPYWQAVDRLTDMAIERSQGRFIVGLPDLHGNLDILAGLREPEDLCVDLIDRPDLVDAATRHAAKTYVDGFNHFYRKVAAAGFGATTWCSFYHEGPAYVPSCDFWCMLSDPMARRHVLPALAIEMQPLARSLFHLDGPQALRHLPLLLEMEQLDAVQWVYGAGAGPAAKWVDVYRQILEAGKSIQLVAKNAADALAVVGEVGLRGVWITLDQPFDDLPQAQAFADEVVKTGLSAASAR